MEFALFATLLLLVIILCAPSKEQPPPAAKVRQPREIPRQGDYLSYGEYIKAFEEAMRESEERQP